MVYRVGWRLRGHDQLESEKALWVERDTVETVRVAFFVGRESARETDIVGRWEIDEISKLILDFRPDGTGTIEVPEVRVRIPITYMLQGDELTITQAPAKGIDIGARMVLERLERTRVSGTGNQLRMEALGGPGQGQVMLVKKIG